MDPNENRCCRKQVAERRVVIQSLRLIKFKRSRRSGMLLEGGYSKRLHLERYKRVLLKAQSQASWEWRDYSKLTKGSDRL